MERYEASTYGDRIATVYDLLYPAGDAEEAADRIAALAESAGGGPVLELGIGTGRIALPLVTRGVAVHGVDASEAMLAQLRAKPGAQGIATFTPDFRAIDADGPYSVIFVAFNTFFALPDAAAQVACMHSVAANLQPGGAFLVEAFVPDPCRYDRGQRTATQLLAGDWVLQENAVHDSLSQKVRMVHTLISGQGIRLFPVELRYAWPAELDLMAQLAGLTLASRHGGWQGEAFTKDSQRHISVWRKRG